QIVLDRLADGGASAFGFFLWQPPTVPVLVEVFQPGRAAGPARIEDDLLSLLASGGLREEIEGGIRLASRTRHGQNVCARAEIGHAIDRSVGGSPLLARADVEENPAARNQADAGLAANR